MFLIAGLGNPDKKYEGTRHNAGFDVIDRVSAEYGILVRDNKCRALCGKGMIEGEKVILVKPQTYMNFSGESVRELVDFYKIDAESQLLVIYDDISLAPGRLRIRGKGSAGGHNGVKNIIAHLGTDVFKRIRVGIGQKPDSYDLVDYVLARFSADEKKIMEEGYENAVRAIRCILKDGIESAMNEFNGTGAGGSCIIR